MALGRALEGTELCELEVGERVVTKRRSAAADFLIPPGNLLLAWHPVAVRMVSVDDWARWEARLYERLHGLRVRRDGDTLLLPRLPGEPVSHQLHDPRALPAAVEALYALHGHDLRGQPLSHGDATAHNVLFDGQTARWFDFDAMHDQRLSARRRHADDLRALLFSAVGCAPQRLEAMLEAVLAYPDASVLRELAAQVTSRRLALSPYHHGQALRSAALHRALVARIRARISG
jgi:hypothetical protein